MPERAATIEREIRVRAIGEVAVRGVERQVGPGAGGGGDGRGGEAIQIGPPEGAGAAVEQVARGVELHRPRVVVRRVEDEVGGAQLQPAETVALERESRDAVLRREAAGVVAEEEAAVEKDEVVVARHRAQRVDAHVGIHRADRPGAVLAEDDSAAVPDDE